MCFVPLNGCFDRLADRCGFHAECLLEFTCVNNKRLFELVHHFHGFFRLRDEKSTDCHHDFAHVAQFRFDACFLRKHAYEFSLRHGGSIVWYVPRLAICLLPLTKQNERVAKILHIGMCMWQIYAPDQLGGLSLQEWIKYTFSHRRVESPRTEEVASTRSRHP